MPTKNPSQIEKRNAKLLKALHRSSQVYWFVQPKIMRLRKISNELKQCKVDPKTLLWMVATYPLQVQWHILKDGLSMLGGTCKDLGILKR